MITDSHVHSLLKATGAAAVVGLFIAAVAGYLMNIVKVFSGLDTMGAGEAVIRIAGMFLGPIGAILGYF